MTETQGRERRIHPRLPLKMLVQFRMHDMNEFMRDHAVNISAGGMFICTTAPHPVGSMVYLQFRLVDGANLIETMDQIKAELADMNGPSGDFIDL